MNEKDFPKAVRDRLAAIDCDHQAYVAERKQLSERIISIDDAIEKLAYTRRAIVETAMACMAVSRASDVPARYDIDSAPLRPKTVPAAEAPERRRRRPIRSEVLEFLGRGPATMPEIMRALGCQKVSVVAALAVHEREGRIFEKDGVWRIHPEYIKSVRELTAVADPEEDAQMRASFAEAGEGFSILPAQDARDRADDLTGSGLAVGDVSIVGVHPTAGTMASAHDAPEGAPEVQDEHLVAASGAPTAPAAPALLLAGALAESVVSGLTIFPGRASSDKDGLLDFIRRAGSMGVGEAQLDTVNASPIMLNELIEEGEVEDGPDGRYRAIERPEAAE